jgi:hypothetical protein
MDNPPCIFCGGPTHVEAWRTGYSISSYVMCETVGCYAQGPVARSEMWTQADAAAIEAYRPLTTPSNRDTMSSERGGSRSVPNEG